MSSVEEATPEPINGEVPGDFKEQLQTLLERLEESDIDAEDLYQNIVAQVRGTPMTEPLKGLEQSIGQYEFDEAAGQVRELLQIFGAKKRA